jgi:hypothetical protein
MTTQVIQHDYGKGRVSLRDIRSAIKAVRNSKAATSTPAAADKTETSRHGGGQRGRKGA